MWNYVKVFAKFHNRIHPFIGVKKRKGTCLGKSIYFLRRSVAPGLVVITFPSN